MNEYHTIETLKIPFSEIEIFSKNIGKNIGSSGDIFTGGMFIETDLKLEPETMLLLEFDLPNTGYIRSFCKVKEKNPTESTSLLHGIEVEFMVLSEVDRNRLYQFIEKSCVSRHKSKKLLNSDDLSLANFVENNDNDIFNKADELEGFLEDMDRKGHLPYFRTLVSGCKNRITIMDHETGKEKEMIMMGSNSYLGLTTHPKVVQAAVEALQEYGVGSGAASVLAGNYDIHKKLESKLANMVGCEDAFLFLSGYTANLGAIQALVRKNDLALVDRLAHASILDGCLFSSGNFRTFKHSNIDHLKSILEINHKNYGGKLILVDGVYSMEGDITPLPDIVNLAKEYGSRVMIDDAHGMGVIGNNGKGTVDHYNLQGQVDLVMGTLGKSFGCLGGFVASTKVVTDYLRYYGRSAFFSTSIPPAIAASTLASLELIEEEPEIIQNLWRNINYMKDNLSKLGYNIGNSQSAIIPIIIGSDLKMRKMSNILHKNGIFINAIPFPAVPKGTERFRMSIMANHTIEDLDKTLNIFEYVGKKYAVINPGLYSTA